jgi:hypothetical protein
MQSEEAREQSATAKLLELVELMNQAVDVAAVRPLLQAQTVLALEEQNRRLAEDHNAFIARFEELVDRFVAALEDGRAAVVRELGELLTRSAASS